MAAASGILGFVDRGLASGLPRHPQKGAARSILQTHPIRIFEGRPQRTCTLFFSLFFGSPLTIRPSRVFEYCVHPFQGQLDNSSNAPRSHLRHGTKRGQCWDVIHSRMAASSRNGEARPCMLTIYVRAETCRAGFIIQTDRRKWLQEAHRSAKTCRCLFNVIYPALPISNVNRFISVPS
jgi:hypothetical protein